MGSFLGGPTGLVTRPCGEIPSVGPLGLGFGTFGDLAPSFFPGVGWPGI